MKKQVFKDILSRLKNAEWLSIDKQRLSLAELCVQADAEALTDGAMFEDLIEFLRCVHAEMGAIIDAARSGIAVKDSVMHVTTFPCHECARHIIGAGIKKVYFIEPYPKSQAVYLHKDAIELEGEDTKKCHFLPFVGVSPRLYTSLFLMGSKRKTGSQVVKWTLRGKIPRMHALADQYLKVEATYVEDFYGIWENSELVNEK
jgi:deoxycytidylate deaminase